MSLLFAALPSLVDLTKTPKLSVRATISEDLHSAGCPLTGQIWLNSSTSSSSSSKPPKPGKPNASPATAVVSSILITARCRTRSEWQDSDGVRRRGEAIVYQLEKQLLPPTDSASSDSSSVSSGLSSSSSSSDNNGIQALALTGPKVVDFKLVLPRAAQRTGTAWNASNRFAFRAGHDIPPSIAGLVEHVLEIEVCTRRAGLFRSPRHLLELPYTFVASRPLPHPRPCMAGFHEKPVGGGARGKKRSDGAADWLVGANLPVRVCIGGELPIELGVRRAPGQAATGAASGEAVLRTLAVNIVSYSVCRVKLAENTGGLDPEAGRQDSVRHRLKDARGLALRIGENTRVDRLVEGIHALAPAGVPTFKTYNAARSYKIEVWICISIGSKAYDLAWSADIHIESGFHRPPVEPPTPPPAPQRSETDANGDDDEYDEDMFLPAYSGPPPGYNEIADNRMSLTTQALRQGVDIIDLL